jgi:hypothetical protein
MSNCLVTRNCKVFSYMIVRHNTEGIATTCCGKNNKSVALHAIIQLITTLLYWGQDRYLHNWIANDAEYDKTEEYLQILTFILFVQDIFIVVMKVAFVQLDIKDKFLHCLSTTYNMTLEVVFISYLGRLYISAKAVLARKLWCDGKYKILKYRLVNDLHPCFLLLRRFVSLICNIKTTNKVHVRCKQHIFILRYKSSYMFRLFI